MWIYLALLGFAIFAVVNILDKFILSTEKVKPIIFVFYSTVFLIPLILLWPFLVNFPGHWINYLPPLVAALGFAGGLYAIYKAEAESEVSHVGPLLGAAIPFFVLILSQIFLAEIITVRQYWAIAVLIIGSLIISFEVSKRHNGWHKGMLWGVFSGLLFAVYQVASKFTYNQFGFAGGLLLIWGFMGVVGAILYLFPSVRKNAFGRASSVKASKISLSKYAKLITIVLDKVLSIVGVLLVQFAVSVGSVSVVNALSGAQYAFLIILVALFSKFSPRVFKEEYSKGEIIQEASAIIIIGVGVALLIV